MAITVHEESQDSKENDNGVKEIPEVNMLLHSETKGEAMEEPQEDILMPTKPEIDKLREPLSLPSLHKIANPYRPSIPLKCHPKKADNKDKPLKMKDPRSFKVNITIGGKEKTQAMLNLKENINIMP